MNSVRKRKQLHLTQAELAARLGTTQSAVARREAGVGNAAIRTVTRLADVPGCVLKLEPKDESGDPPSKTPDLLPSGNRSH